MNSLPGSQEMETTRIRLSTLWIFVLFNMVFADIVGFMNPGALQDILSGSVGFEITQELLLVFAILLEIPIAMIFLARFLNRGANRIVNIAASLLTALFIIGGGTATLSYYFFAAMEILGMAAIVWTAWNWRPQA